MKKSISYITKSAIIAGIYIVLSLISSPISFGPIQIRVAEILTLLPVILPNAVPGLVVGCFFSNLFLSPFGLIDILIGTLATLIGAVGTRMLRQNIALATLPPIVANALLVPIIFVLCSVESVYIISALQILGSGVVTVAIIGVPFTLALKKVLIKANLIKPDTKTSLKHLKYERRDKTN